MSNNSNISAPAWVEDPIAPAAPVSAIPAVPIVPAAPAAPVAPGNLKLPAKPSVPVTAGSPCILALGGQQLSTQAEVDWLASLTPDNSTRYTCNDIGLALLFADFVKPVARYVVERKQWYIYTGGVWSPDTGNLAVMELCKRLTNGLYRYSEKIADDDSRTEYRKYLGTLDRKNKRDAVLKDAASVYFVKFSQFDKDPYLINCLNGTLDLKSGVFSPHNPSDLLTKMAGVKYDPNATCRRWVQFVDEVTMGDKQLAIYLQKALGYALSGDTSEECFFLLFGPKSRNGKSTMMETVMHIMGDYGKSARPETIGERHTSGSAPNEDIARLAGARLVNIAEPDKQLVLSVATVKTLTGNDTITARFLHENSFEFKPQFKMFVNTNHLPRATDNTIFASGRVKVIPFQRHFSPAEQDKTLKSTLTQPRNLSGILNWLIQGYNLFQSQRLVPPPAVEQATAEYRRDNDKYSRFLNDEFDSVPGGEERTTDAYTRYKIWCDINGFRWGSIQSFTSEISKLVTVERRRPRTGGNKTTLICDLQLKAH